MKKYYLYLDESGDFDSDLDNSRRNECVVGGLLVMGDELREAIARKILIESWHKVKPEDAGLTDQNVFEKVNHATELTVSQAELATQILDRAEKKGRFIIFENYAKNRIIDSNTTYLTILVDGIMQLLNQLVLSYPSEKIQLNVTIGRRVDTERTDVKAVIEPIEYERRLKERLLLAKIKNSAVYNQVETPSINFSSDKRNPVLVLCDYVCNTYMTRDSSKFVGKNKDGVRYRDYLLEKYDEKMIFALNGSVKGEKLMAQINVKDYDGILFDSLTENFDESEQELALRAFTVLAEPTRHNYLKSLSNMIKIVVDDERNLELGDVITKRALILINRLKEEGKHDAGFEADVILFRLAICNHLGLLDDMEQLFIQFRSQLPEMLKRIENIDYAFMYYNRYAVYLFDSLRIVEACDLLKEVTDLFSAYELIITALPGVGIEPESILSDQQARLLGTYVQCMNYRFTQGEVSYDEAREASEQAIHHFSHIRDKQRQYQYRVLLESSAGHFEAAEKMLCEGFGVKSIEDACLTMSDNPFFLYHFSILAKNAASANYEKASEYIALLEKKEGRIDNTDYPGFITIANLAYATSVLGEKTKRVSSRYKAAVKMSENGPLIFILLKIMIYAEFMLYSIENNATVVDTLSDDILRMIQIADGYRKSTEYEELLKEMKGVIEAGDKDAIRSLAKRRQY